ncbi:MAG: amino acid adenylation domain-containing protein [Legionellaceae bacterium]|nr:amino acid adenylation domain-containing protein [Legionellaceae bacterium]
MDAMRENKSSYQKGSSCVVDRSLIPVFLEHVRATPDKLAVISSHASWTYQDLCDDMLAWMHRLNALSEISAPVILCLHRTPVVLSLLLALQLLEKAYIPVDPETPYDRIRAICEDSHAALLLHDATNHEVYASLPCNVWALADLERAGYTQNDELIPYHSSPDSKALAYVIYTSGSTGTPKGVCVSRGALDNFLTSMSHNFLNEPDAMVLATTTFTFDIAALELFLPIWQNKTLFLANEVEHKDPLCIEQILKKYPVTLLQGTPSFWSMLHYSGWQGKRDLVALCGGEPLTPEVAAFLLPHVSELWNMYGPTEATIWCSLKKITSDRLISVGKPIHNLDMCVLDASMQVVPVGCKGELYIGGLGLAEGYMGQEALTKERFVMNPAAHVDKPRLYRTGDVASMNENDEFIIYGRVDNQVKLHGYRIELEDIEAHIKRRVGVRDCAVLVHDEQLVAYICRANKTSYSEDAVKQSLAQELPDFMLPKRFIYLEKLPLNSSGKLNRHALLKPEQTHQHELTHVTCMQASLLNIWCEALGLVGMSIEDNFFELGGHSLVAVRIVVSVKKILGKDVSVFDLYQAPSVLEFSERVRMAPDYEDEAHVKHKQHDASWMPLTDFQFVLWISNLFDAKVKKLNVVGRRRIQCPLDPVILNRALQAVIQKHDALSYAIHRFLPIQKKQSRQIIAWEEHVFLDDDQQEFVETNLNQSLQALHDYQGWSNKKPFLRAKLFQLNNGCTELQLAMPHMVSDQQSLEILFRDLSNAYLFYLRNPRANTRLESHVFESYVHHESQVVRASVEQDDVFWSKYLRDAELFSFPKMHVVSDMKKADHDYSSFFEIDEAQQRVWRNFCVKHAVTLSDLLCASVGIALQRCCQDDVEIPQRLFINSVNSTREQQCYDHVIGCFLRSQAIKLDLGGDNTLLKLAKQVQRSARETSRHQYSSSLVKLAAVGDLNCSKQSIKSCLIACIEKICARISNKPYHLSLPILNACKRLANLDSDRGFVVNVNIWSSFFSEHEQDASKLFGADCCPIHVEHEDVFNIDDVLDVCLFKDVATNTAYLALSANLKPNFREHLGQAMLSILH